MASEPVEGLQDPYLATLYLTTSEHIKLYNKSIFGLPERYRCNNIKVWYPKSDSNIRRIHKRGIPNICRISKYGIPDIWKISKRVSGVCTVYEGFWAWFQINDQKSGLDEKFFFPLNYHIIINLCTCEPIPIVNWPIYTRSICAQYKIIFKLNTSSQDEF